MKLRELIKQERIRQGITQKSLAEKCGIRTASVSDFENGKCSIYSDSVDKMIEALGVKVSFSWNDVGRSKQLFCDVCGSDDVIEAPHMGRNCNRCHPL